MVQNNRVLSGNYPKWGGYLLDTGSPRETLKKKKKREPFKRKSPSGRWPPTFGDLRRKTPRSWAFFSSSRARSCSKSLGGVFEAGRVHPARVFGRSWICQKGTTPVPVVPTLTPDSRTFLVDSYGGSVLNNWRGVFIWGQH